MKKYENLAFLFNIENNFDLRRQLSNSHYSLKNLVKVKKNFFSRFLFIKVI